MCLYMLYCSTLDLLDKQLMLHLVPGILRTLSTAHREAAVTEVRALLVQQLVARQAAELRGLRGGQQ